MRQPSCSRNPKERRLRFRKIFIKAFWIGLCPFLLPAFTIEPAPAQQRLETQPDYGRNTEWFPGIFKPYQSQRIPEIRIENSDNLLQLIDNGTMRISLSQAKTAANENNLDILSTHTSARYAQTDMLRAKGGGAPRGGAGVQIPSSLFSGAIGAGLEGSGGLGGFGSVGGISGGGRQVRASPRGGYDPSFALGFSIDQTTSPLNSLVVSGIPEVTTKSIALQTRFSQAFSTGSSVSISFNNMRQSSTQRRLRFNPNVVSLFSITLTQQLLNGFGFAAGRRFLDVAENENEIARENIRLQTATTLAKAQNNYWDLVAAQENVRVASQSLEVARRLLEDNREREELGAVSVLDVVTAESEMAARQRDLVRAQTTLEMSEVELKNTISADVTSILSSVRIEPTDNLPEPAVRDIPKLNDALKIALENRPEIRRAEINLRIQDIAIKYVKNQLKPDLMVFALFNSSGLYGNNIPIGTSTVLSGGLSQAMRQVRDWRYPEYAVGFSFSMNIRNQAAQADSARAKIEKRQSETSLQRLRNTITLEVRKAIIGLVQSGAQVEAARAAVERSGAALEAEESRLTEGLAIPYDVIRRQRDYRSARFAEVQARSGYAKALVEMDRALGVIDPMESPHGN
jgi:outer membrane protein